MPLDTASIPLPSADAIAALSPESRDAARATYSKFYPADRVAAVFDDTLAPVAPAATAIVSGSADAPPAATADTKPAPYNPNAGLSREQLVSGYKAALKFAVDPAAVIRSAKAAGIDLATETGAVDVPASSIDAQLAQANELDAITHPTEVPRSPAGYKLTYNRETIRGMDASDVAAFDADVKQALHAASVPANLSQSIVDAIDSTVGLYPEDASEADRKAIFADEGHKLYLAFGVEGAQEIARLATAAENRLPADFREEANKVYAFHSAQALVALANVEREYQHRTGGQK